MKEISFYRWSAALPMLLPLPAYVVAWHTRPPRGVVSSIATLVAVAGIAACPAYIPFIAGLLCWLRKKPVASYRIASFLAPILFVPCFVAYLLVLDYWGPSPEPFAENVKFYLPYLLGVGFGYVVFVHLLRLGLSFCGWVNGGEGSLANDALQRPAARDAGHGR
jgi:hypothetical protein